LAVAGLYGGDPERVLRARVDLVLAAVDFLNYQADLAETHRDLNKPEDTK
jgi:hypothetical protein